jgi:TolB-like protein/DNA-binding winged helix-turn-helix (wHTH) protein/Tfp pilus assembly protein PilF
VSSPLIPAQVVRFGVFEANLRSGELRKSGIKIKLHDQPFQILAMLLERPGELVTRDELRQKLWPADTFVDFNHGLNNAVLRLREVLGDSADTPRFIETIPRRGYRLIVAVECPARAVQNNGLTGQAAGAAPAEALANVATAPLLDTSKRDDRSTGRQYSSRAAILVSVVLVLVLLGVSVGVMFLRPSTNLPRIQSLVVLPLENVSGDPTQDYLADGITDSLITSLARLGSVRVISRTSAMHYKNSRQRLPEIARELDVDAVIEGTISRTGDHVRINAQLIDARNDHHLWAEVFERDAHDVLALQGELARTIADQVANRADPQQHIRLQTKQVNPEAYESYLKGRYFWNKRTEAGYIKAIEFFEEAIAKQPDYAQAYAGLSDAYALLGWTPPAQFSRSDTMARARAAAFKALEIDDTVAEAHTSLASISMVYDWNWSVAEKEFRRAIELNPGYATAHHWYAFYCASQGWTEEALVEIRIAKSLDPLSLIINEDVGRLLYFARRYDEAIEQSRRTLEMDPTFAPSHVTAGLAYLAKQQYSESLAELESAVRVAGNDPGTMATLGIAYAEAGREAEARKILKQTTTAAATHDVPVLKVAWLYAALGDRDRAFAWAEKLYQARSPEFYTLKVLPALDPWRSDPRFQDLMRRIGLSSDGQSHGTPG